VPTEYLIDRRRCVSPHRRFRIRRQPASVSPRRARPASGGW
jgi:hypothetical protein